MDNKLIFYYLLIISIIYMFIMCLNVCRRRRLPGLSSQYGHGQVVSKYPIEYWDGCNARTGNCIDDNDTARLWKRKMDGWMSRRHHKNII